MWHTPSRAVISSCLSVIVVMRLNSSKINNRKVKIRRRVDRKMIIIEGRKNLRTRKTDTERGREAVIVKREIREGFFIKYQTTQYCVRVSWNSTRYDLTYAPSVFFPRHCSGSARALKLACLMRLRALHTLTLLRVRNLYAR